MSYLEIIQIGISVFPLAALLFTTPFVIVQYKKHQSVNYERAFVLYSMVFYLLCAYFMVILPLPDREYVKTLTTVKMQLMPFHFVREFIRDSGFLLTEPSTYLPAFKSFAFLQAAFNVLLTVPFGFYLRYYFKISFRKTLLISFLFSLFFELTQLSGLYFIYPRPYRLFDVDDLFLNTLGGITGYGVCGLCGRILPSVEKADSIPKKSAGVLVGFKRILSFALDFLLCILISGFFTAAGLPDGILYVVVAVWFLAVPVFFGGKTIAGAFFNVKTVCDSGSRMLPAVRMALILINYAVLPSLMFMLINHVLLTYGKDSLWFLPIGAIDIFIMPLYYLICIFGLLIRNRTWYDRLCQCRCVDSRNHQE